MQPDSAELYIRLIKWLSDPIVVLILSFMVTGFVIRRVSRFLESRKK